MPELSYPGTASNRRRAAERDVEYQPQLPELPYAGAWLQPSLGSDSAAVKKETVMRKLYIYPMILAAAAWCQQRPAAQTADTAPANETLGSEIEVGIRTR